MGLSDQCICCSCLSKEKSVEICTYLMIVFNCLSIACSVLFRTVGLGDIITVGLIFSLIFLLIGIKNGKKSYLKQFDTVFGLLVVLESIGVLYIVVICLIGIGTALYASNKEGLQDELDIGEDTNTSGTKAVVLVVVELVLVLIYYILTLYYYITTRKYVIERVKEIDNENKIKQLENGAK